jgi:hypothetical protein
LNQRLFANDDARLARASSFSAPLREHRVEHFGDDELKQE